MWRSRCQVVCLFQFTHVLYRYDMCIIRVCNSDTTFTYLIFTSYKCIKMCVKKKRVRCVDCTYTCTCRYALYLLLVLLCIFVLSSLCEIWTMYGTHQVPTQDDCNQAVFSISTEVQTTSPMRQQKRKRTGEILELHRHVGPADQPCGPFSFEKKNASFQNQKQNLYFVESQLFSFGQLSFSPLFLFIDVVCIYIYKRKYVYIYI